MEQRYWAPKPLWSETLTALATFPSHRDLEEKEIPDLVISRLDDLMSQAKLEGQEVEELASELLQEISNRDELTGEVLLQTLAGSRFLSLLDWSQTELQPLPPDQLTTLESLSFLTALEAL